MDNYWDASKENWYLWLALPVDDQVFRCQKHVANSKIWNWTQQVLAHDLIARCHLHLFGPLMCFPLRHPTLVCYCFHPLNAGWRWPRGAPHTQWHDVISDTALSLRQDTNQLEHVMCLWVLKIIFWQALAQCKLTRVNDDDDDDGTLGDNLVVVFRLMTLEINGNTQFELITSIKWE